MSLLSNATEPGRIHRLDPLVVNRIAAGEVIQRPSNALKELLENALDAGSTSISVTVKGGGLTSLSIQDNGCGIPVSDFPLLAERFATSKLEKFDDLRTIETFGFRGEALASISMVSRMTVVSMTQESPCAWKATYSDGKMLGEPRPTAGVQGTTITAENMFYNVPARRAAFSRGNSPQDEYNRIIDVVNRYGILFSDKSVSFSVRKAGSASADVSIHCNNSLDALGVVFGGTIKKELIEFKAENGMDQDDVLPEDASKATVDVQEGIGSEVTELEKDVLKFKCTGWVSSGTYHSLVTSFAGNASASSHSSRRKGAFILFINNRLVENSALRKAMEAVYQSILPRGAKPFIYLNIQMPPSHLDVNVHPTKREVAFLHQEQLIITIQERLSQLLEGVNKSRVFFTQSLLPLPSTLLPGADVPALSTAANAPSSISSTQPSETSSSVGEEDPNARLASVDSALSQFLREEYSSRDKSASTSTALVGEEPSSGAKEAPRYSRNALPTASVKPSVAKAASTSNLGLLETSSAAAPTVQAHKKVRIDHSDYRGMERFVQRGKKFAKGGSTGAEMEEDASVAATSSVVQAASTGNTMGPSSSVHAASTTSSSAMDMQDSNLASTGNELTPTPGTEPVTRSHLRDPSCWQPVYFTSIQTLLNDILRRQHKGLQKVLERGIFVGLLDNDLSLIQSDTNLLLLHHVQCMRELFYQQALALFSNVNSFPLSSPFPVQSNILFTLHSNGIGTTDGQSSHCPPLSGTIDVTFMRPKADSSQQVGNRNSSLSSNTTVDDQVASTSNTNDSRTSVTHVHTVAAMVTKLLQSKGELLREYFGIVFEPLAYCLSSPSSIGHQTPNSASYCDKCRHPTLSAVLLPENRILNSRKPPSLSSVSSIPPSDTSANDLTTESTTEPTLPPTSPSCIIEKHLSVVSLPRLLTNHTPYFPLLPAFLVHLAFGVDWTDELMCFHTIAQALGVFYSMLPPIPLEIGIGQGLLPPQSGIQAATREEVESYRVHPKSPYVIMETIIFPALKNPKLFTAPRKISENGFIVRLASTERLYRIFERC